MLNADRLSLFYLFLSQFITLAVD